MKINKLFLTIGIAATTISPIVVASSCNLTIKREKAIVRIQNNKYISSKYKEELIKKTDLAKSYPEIKKNINVLNSIVPFNYPNWPKSYELDKVGTIFDNIIQISDSDEKKYNVTLWEYFHAVEAEVTHLADGDTITVRVIKQPVKLPTEAQAVVVPETMSIRIANIDTLEENTNNVSERESSLAKMDHAFADSLVLGQRVKLISSNWTTKSYNRFVANVFFGENYSKNFGIEMLANGYTLARLNTIDFNSFKYGYQNKTLLENPNISSFLMPYLAYAINSAAYEKKGFYGANVGINSPAQFSLEYEEHDKNMIDHSSMILRPEFLIKPGLATYKNNIYKFFEKLEKNN
ncbi:thermonuclease family protein [Metamycoplasma neophronis]|uniref:TNase-like domain-containing protein n=1 Tax=Metamycoplasma neophronis TaxID=872983 RepID=A0ABY2Z0H5_9BACT|nr:thermonuclease family protein [Metamycoplasma neophronis]TPR54650.1 hypothetical protein FJR74_00030 [Metamycoplasma neophronis]